jgi:hypothetical protein
MIVRPFPQSDLDPLWESAARHTAGIILKTSVAKFREYLPAFRVDRKMRSQSSLILPYGEMA